MLVLEIAIFWEDLGGDCTVQPDETAMEVSPWMGDSKTMSFPLKNDGLCNHFGSPPFFVRWWFLKEFVRKIWPRTHSSHGGFVPKSAVKTLGCTIQAKRAFQEFFKVDLAGTAEPHRGSTHWGVDGFGVTNSWLVHANFTCVFYWCCFLMIELNHVRKNWKNEKKHFFGAALVRWPPCCWPLIIYAAVSAGNMVSSKIWASVRMQRMQLISEWEYI